MRERIQIVANPVSGGGLAAQLVPALSREFEQRGHRVSVLITKGPGEIRALAETFPGTRGLRGLIVMGGDGTMREVVAADPGPELPILAVPLGSANVLATELGLPRRPEAITETFLAGRSKVVDTGLARGEGQEEPHPFLLMAGAGFDADIIEAVHRTRAGGTLGKLRYVWPTLRLFAGFRPKRHWVLTEDGRREGPFAQVILTNVRAYGGLWKLPGDPVMDDGRMDLIGLRARTSLGLALHGLRGFLNLVRKGPKVHHERFERIRIECDQESRFQIDGDPGGPLPLEVEVRPARLRLILP